MKKLIVVLALIVPLMSVTASKGEVVELADGSVAISYPFGSAATLPTQTIPIKMRVGMHVQVITHGREILLQSISCGAIGKNNNDYPCYHGCISFDVRTNFKVQLGGRLKKLSEIVSRWEAYYPGADAGVVPGDGFFHSVSVCVKSWQSRIWFVHPGEAEVGSLTVTVMPAP